MARRRLVCGLDVGTTKVLAVAAEVRPGGEPVVVGVGTSPSRGLRRGVVIDIESTVQAVQEAVGKAERMGGVPLGAVTVGVAGGHVSCLNTRGVVAVTRGDREITLDDVQRVLEAARVIDLPPDREIIHVLPRQYIVDGCEGVRDPVGMLGSRLEVDACVVTGASTNLHNLVRAVERAGLEVDDIVFSPLAAAEAVLMPDEKELGVVLADIGGGTTDVAVFHQGSLIRCFVLPVGGENVTTDVAVGVRTSLAQAEIVKIDYGSALVAMTPDEKVLPIPTVGGQGIQHVSAKFLAEIIEARLREILAAIAAALRQSPWPGGLPGGVVLTGGVAATHGIAELAAEELGLPVRVGTAEHLGGLEEVAALPSFATAAGLAAMAAGTRGAGRTRHAGRFGGVADRLRGWLREIL